MTKFTSKVNRYLDGMRYLCYHRFTSQVNPKERRSVGYHIQNRRIEKVCTDARTAERTYGREMADKIHQRIEEIDAADTVEMMIQFHIGRCHPLTQNRKGQYAVDLVHPYRLVFEKNGNEIQIANILEIVDYH